MYVGISPGLFDSNDSELKTELICKKRDHDFAFSSADIILQNLETCSHRVTAELLGSAVIMLATLGHVCR
jgi:hypothetical protein